MRVYKLALLCLLFLSLSGILFSQALRVESKLRAKEASAERISSSVEYRLEYDAEIPLRVTEIPSEFGMLKRDLEGNLEPLKKGDEIILESIHDLKVSEYFHTDDKNAGIGVPRHVQGKVILKAGTKFYARVINSELAKSFNRDGFIELEFYKIEAVNQSINIKAGELISDNLEKRESLSNKASKVAKVAGYTLGGALIAPLITYKIVGLLAFSNPYITGGAAATGAALGLAYGISSKGKNFNLEPGTELKLKLNSDWLLSEFVEKGGTQLKAEQAANEISEKASKAADKAKLKINKVKKAGSNFNQKCLKINLDYENPSGEAIRYLSFRLVDSMNKEYFPEGESFRAASLGELDRTGNLNLLYCVDYLKAIYTLELHSIDDYEILASEKIILGK